jgi:biopolymer transport protein ExbD
MIDEKPVKRIDLTKELAALYRDGKDHRIDIGAERSVPYGELYDILDRLRQGGYRKVNLIAYEGGADSNRPAAADLTLPNSMPAVPQQ